MQPRLFKIALQKTYYLFNQRHPTWFRYWCFRRYLSHYQARQTTIICYSTTASHITNSGSSQFTKFCQSSCCTTISCLAEMTLPQFQKFWMDWNVFKHVTNITWQQINVQLYRSCDAHVQNSIVNSVRFFLSEGDLLNAIERIVTKHSNPSVHCLTFSSTLQLTNEQYKSILSSWNL